MELDPTAVRDNARRAETEDLLDRVIVYHAGMDPIALDIIRAELASRGLTAADEVEHALTREADTVLVRDGIAVRCTFCDRPAVTQELAWHRLWGWLPVFPRQTAYCAEHARYRPSRTAVP